MGYSKVVFFVCAISSLMGISGYAKCGPNSSNVGAGLAAPRFQEIEQMAKTFQAPMPTTAYSEFSNIPQLHQGYMIPGTFQAKVPNAPEPRFGK